MAEKSQIQIAIDKIEAEIQALVNVRDRLYEAQSTPQKRKPRKAPIVAGAEKAS